MPRNNHEDHLSPVSYPVNIARLPQKGLPVEIRADAEQLLALASAHDLESVRRYRADILVAAWRRHGVRMSGRVRAEIVQTCVVTLEPIETMIDEVIEAVFLPEESKLGRLGFETGGEIVIDVEGDDAPETFSGNYLDPGALSEEFFGLAIDPYPRKQGVGLEPATDDAKEEQTPEWKSRLAGLAKQK